YSIRTLRTWETRNPSKLKTVKQRQSTRTMVLGFLWGRWRELMGSRGLWWSGKEIGESGADNGAWVLVGKMERAYGESWVVVEWQGNRGKWCCKLGGKLGSEQCWFKRGEKTGELFCNFTQLVPVVI
nr:hypothetical protein [Tanacetum cinerariifolium]